jgi:hypothetical protein
MMFVKPAQVDNPKLTKFVGAVETRGMIWFVSLRFVDPIMVTGPYPEGVFVKIPVTNALFVEIANPI